ncbi:MAG: hypothetical protein GY711_10900 [bacterium]|nr:hypothetical protein [bacterium]
MRPLVLAAFAAASLFVLGLAASQDPAEPKGTDHEAWLARTHSDGRLIRLEDTSGNDCIRCHEEVGEQWRHGTHASAWQDEHYQKELKGIRKKQKCWGCHVPQPLAAQGFPQRPEPRAENRHLGIDCVACHQDADGETILGPWGHRTDAHPTKKSELFDDQGDSAMCVACHATSIGPVIGIAKDFVDTDQPDLGLSCIGCHMPALEHRVANDPDGVKEYEVRRGRSHRLMTPRDPEFLRSAFRMKAKRADGKAVLTISNETGHRVPGLMKRALVFKIKLFDAGGKLVGEAEHTIDNRSYLPVEEELAISVEGEGTSLVVIGLHEAPGFKRPMEFLDRTFEL